MGITSYAQNFEDVMLWRALGEVKDGFYIDVGAQHPVIDSVTKAFYESGWRGIDVEPTVTYSTMLREDRPDDIVLQVALAERAGLLKFYEIPETGISTADAGLAERYKGSGKVVHEITVPCMTLSSVFEVAGAREIHWLKIDVEGFERQVLEGWGSSPARPWIVVVESTLPLTTIESHEHWENLLTERGYKSVYFDGLNRFYTSAEHPDLASFFVPGPNLFDEFFLNGTANASFCWKLLSRHREEMENLRHEAQHAADAGRREIAELNTQLAGRRDNESLDLIAHVNQFDEDARNRESKLSEQLASVQAELLILSESLAQREQEFAARMLEVRIEAKRIAEQTANRLQAQEDSQMRWLADREQKLNEQLDSARADQMRLLHDAAARESLLAQQATQFRQEAEARLWSLVQREQQFALQLHELRNKLDRVSAERERESLLRTEALERRHAQLDAANTARIDRLQNRCQDLLSHAAQRERQFATESWQRDLENRRQLQELDQVHSAGLKAVEMQLVSGRQRFHEIEIAERARQDELNQRLAEKQQAMDALVKAYSDLERHLHAQLAQEQQAAQTLREQILALQASFAWRLGEPLRRLRSRLGWGGGDVLFSAAENSAGTSHIESVTNDVVSHEVATRRINNSLVMTNISSPISARTLDELLSYHDRQFVHCAYMTLLGRLPDTDGEFYYLGRLRVGYGKARVLAQLASSTEAKNRGVKLPGLERLLAEQRRAKHWFWRIFERGARMERRANLFEHELGFMSNRLAEISSHQQGLANQVQEIGQAINDLLAISSERGEATAREPKRVVTVHDVAHRTEKVNDIATSELSIPVKGIFVELGKAVAAARTEGDK